MSDGKGLPIPTRFSTEDQELLEKLAEATGLNRSEIIRRLVSFGLSEAKTRGSIDFLLHENNIAELLEATPKAAEEPGKYKAKKKPKKE